MNDVKTKLEEKMQQIEYNKRVESGNILDHEDLNVVFNILKENDKELLSIYESIEEMCHSILETNYILVEKQVKNFLKYYNILNGNDILNSRHQFFFTEARKLVKKPYFSQDKMENIKQKLNENNIFRKIGINDEI